MNGCIMQLESISAACGATSNKLCHISGHTAPLETTANEKLDGGFDAGVTRIARVHGVDVAQSFFADGKLVVQRMKFVVT